MEAASLWTLDDLGTQVALALSVNYDGTGSNRVRDIPDRRTIRYYTTLGLLDRPAAFQGRTALYGRRHLLQLVAIKRLQARGSSLAQVQERLLGLPNSSLAELARLPDEPNTQIPAEELRTEFWKTPPVTRAAAAMEKPEDTSSHPSPAPALVGIPLNDAVTLLLGAVRPIEFEDIEAIRIVAEPLLKLLHSRRLLGRATKGTHDEPTDPHPV